ncbi:MAG: hypothetical protein NT131_03880 [Methanomassiliicoccales archaeon]|nr:hypothetical protein [Methanomassiliicoccales archaeon]
MATKRKLVIHNTETVEEEGEEPPSQPWLKRVYAKYWFWLLALALATMVPLEIVTRHEEWGGLRWSAAFIFIAGVVILFVILYLKIWGKDGIWGED